MASLMDEYPMPGMEIDPRELEKAKYLALMRMGLGLAGKENIGRAAQGGINTYLAGDEAARRNADQKMQEMKAKMAYAMSMKKAAEEEKKRTGMLSLLDTLGPDTLESQYGVPKFVYETAKLTGDVGPILKAMEAQTTKEGDVRMVGNQPFVVRSKDGRVPVMSGGVEVGQVTQPGYVEDVAARAAAVRAAEQRNTFQTNVPGPGGPRSGYPENIGGGLPPAMAGQAAPQGARPAPVFNLQNQSREGQAAMVRDLQNPMPEPSAAGFVQGQDPMVAERTKQGNAALMEYSKPIFEDQRKLKTAADALAKHVTNMKRLDENGVYSGPAGFVWEKWGNAWNSALPEGLEGLSVNPDKLANTQTFTSEVSKMQQALGKAFPGQQSNYELQVVTNALPQLMLTKEGRVKIYAAIQSAAKHEQDNYASMAEHAQRNQGDLTTWKPLPFPEPPREFGLRQGERAGTIGNATVTGFPGGPPVGTVINGKRFKGGNPKDRANWE